MTGGPGGPTTRYVVAVSGRIAAPPARVYGVIADYRQHHPHIVPREYFPHLEVLAGGVGAGTRTRVQMRVLGAAREFEQDVTEPEPGRVIMETDSDGLSVTTFTVDEIEDGTATHLTIATELVARPGLAGALERFVTTWMLRRIYRKEIAQLAAYVA